MNSVNAIHDIKLDYMPDLIFAYSMPTMHYWYTITYMLLIGAQAFRLHSILTTHNINNSGGRKRKYLFDHQGHVQNLPTMKEVIEMSFAVNEKHTNCVNPQWQRFSMITSNLVTVCLDYQQEGSNLPSTSSYTPPHVRKDDLTNTSWQQ